MARFALAAPKVQQYISYLGSGSDFNNNMGDLWADVYKHGLNEKFDDLQWEQDIATQDQRMSHLEKMQKLHNDHAKRMGSVGENNKWHSLAQGAVGLGANWGANQLANQVKPSNFDAVSNIWNKSDVPFYTDLNLPTFSS